MKLIICTFLVLVLTALGAGAAEGPQCTYTYPQGFTVTNYKLVKVKKVVKVRRVQRCTNGELGATWRVCELRYHA